MSERGEEEEEKKWHKSELNKKTKFDAKGG